MSVADRDGRIAQALSDRMACLSMEIHESLFERLAAFLDQHGDAVPMVCVSDLRHSEPAGRAVDQADAEALLEQPDASAEPGAWHAERPCGCCEAAVFDHLGEEVKIVEVLHGP